MAYNMIDRKELAEFIITELRSKKIYINRVIQSGTRFMLQYVLVKGDKNTLDNIRYECISKTFQTLWTENYYDEVSPIVFSLDYVIKNNEMVLYPIIDIKDKYFNYNIKRFNKIFNFVYRNLKKIDRVIKKYE